jgi:hypothetical protein
MKAEAKDIVMDGKPTRIKKKKKEEWSDVVTLKLSSQIDLSRARAQLSLPLVVIQLTYRE